MPSQLWTFGTAAVLEGPDADGGEGGGERVLVPEEAGAAGNSTALSLLGLFVCGRSNPSLGVAEDPAGCS